MEQEHLFTIIHLVNKMKERIASFVRTYLFPSETFIYEEIKNIRRFEVLVLTLNIINNHLFPYADIIAPDKKESHFSFLKAKKREDFFCKILRQQNIRLVHAWYGWSGIEILPACKRAGVPLITSLHGQDVSKLPHNFSYRRKLRRLFQQGDLFLVRSNAMKEDVIKLGCSSKKIVVHYGGVDISKFKPGNRKNKKSARILMCGRMVEKKGFQYGILAFSIVLKKHPNTSLSIIGEGRLKKKLEKLVKSLKIEDKVKFLGAVPHSQVQKEMEEADIFLSPNVTSRDKDKEGVPNVIKEAMAAALPVVSTYHAGIPELVVNRETGFLTRERDVESLAEKLDYLLSYPELREIMGKKGRKRIEEKFNLSSQVKELEDVYSQLLKKKFCVLKMFDNLPFDQCSRKISKNNVSAVLP